MFRFNLKLLTLFLLMILVAGCFWDKKENQDLNQPDENLEQIDQNQVRLTKRQKDEKAIVDLIKSDQGLGNDQISLIIEYYSGDHLRGSLFVGGKEEEQQKLETGKIILAYKENDSWQIAYLGNGQIKCDLAKQLNFPEEMTADCRVK